MRSLDPSWISSDSLSAHELAAYPGKLMVVRELLFHDDYGAENANHLGLVTDTETTGVDRSVDRITEFCFIPFYFNNQGEIGKILPAKTWLNDPKIPIPPNVQELTGITDEMVKGHKAPPQEIADLMNSARCVIAHNAPFDRAMIDRFLAYHDLSAPRPWICSSSDIDWRSFQITSAKLDYLAFKFGFFFSHHRAESDCRATIEILASRLPNGNTVLGESFKAFSPRFNVCAVGSPFESKDLLKRRGYRWNPDQRVWWKEIAEADLEPEKQWLNDEVYRGGSPQIEPVNVNYRHTN